MVQVLSTSHAYIHTRTCMSVIAEHFLCQMLRQALGTTVRLHVSWKPVLCRMCHVRWVKHGGWVVGADAGEGGNQPPVTGDIWEEWNLAIPGWGRSSGEGNGYPLQHSCLGNPMDRGAWKATSPWSLKESDRTERLHFLFSFCHSTVHL